MGGILRGPVALCEDPTPGKVPYIQQALRWRRGDPFISSKPKGYSNHIAACYSPRKTRTNIKINHSSPRTAFSSLPS
jgi:hypothetical protein